jgi:hypothetical protein
MNRLLPLLLALLVAHLAGAEGTNDQRASTTADNIDQFLNSVNSNWTNRNYSQILSGINARLSRDSNDVLALSLKMGYHVYCEPNGLIVHETASNFLNLVKSSNNPESLPLAECIAQRYLNLPSSIPAFDKEKMHSLFTDSFPVSIESGSFAYRFKETQEATWLHDTNSIKMVFCKNGQLSADEVQSLLRLATAKGFWIADTIVTYTQGGKEIFIRIDERETRKDDKIRRRSINVYKKGWVDPAYENVPIPTAKVSVGDFFTDRVIQSCRIEVKIAGETMQVPVSEGISKDELVAIFTAIGKGNIRAFDDGQTDTVARLRKEGLKPTSLSKDEKGRYCSDFPSGMTMFTYTNGEVVILWIKHVIE